MSTVPARIQSGGVERLATSAARGNAASSDAPTFRLTRPNGIGIAVRDFSHACLVRLIDFPDLPMRTGTTEPIKAGGATTLVRTEFPIAGRPVAAAWKRVRRTTWLKRLTGMLRPNACLRNFQLGLELLRRGVPTARPLAVVYPRRFAASSESFLATEWIENGANVYHVLANIARMPPQDRRGEIARAAIALGRLLGTMHARGVAHRDLKPANLMLRSRWNQWEAFVIDLDGITLGRTVGRRIRARNLSRLVVDLTAHCPVVTRSEYLRGLHAYLNIAEPAGNSWKAAWREIAAETARRGNQPR